MRMLTISLISSEHKQKSERKLKQEEILNMKSIRYVLQCYIL